MPIRPLSLLLSVALFTLSLGPVPALSAESENAAEKTVEQIEKAGTEKPTEEEMSPAEKAKDDALTERISTIMESLDLNQVQHFTVIYANYMILSLVKAVRNDVQKAVEGCASNNKEMETEMTTRFEGWKTAVSGPMQESEANINNMIVAQNYLPKAEFDEIFALVDETRAKNSSEFEKVPVNTPEACKYMLGKMDETQKNMTQLLSSTLITYPDMLKKTQE